MTKKLENKVAFITGGNSGIGLATAELFARHGAKVIITGLDRTKLEEAKAKIGKEVLALEVDVTDMAQLDQAFQQSVQTWGRIDIVFANAGIGKFAPVTATSEAVYDQIMNVNVKGLFFTVQKAIRHLNKHASIILNGSFLTFTGLPNTSVLSASKAAVSSLGRTLAAELAPEGIRVNTISPGYVATSFAARSGLTPQALTGLAQNAVLSTPLRRLGSPEEIANVALFLASDDSSYLVGSDILVDGGVVNA